MSIASQHNSDGFTLSYFERLSRGGGYLGDLDVSIDNWRHSINAFGGFDSASFELFGSMAVLEDWIQNGLFRPIVVKDQYLTTIWEGFINSITINQAGLSVTHGPITEISNRIFAIYSGIDTTVYPPRIGVRKITPTQNNLISQADWGIWPLILSLAGVTDANSDQLVSMYLSEHGHPEINSNFSFSGGDISLTVNCAGWFSALKYPFNFSTNSGTVSITTRIIQILMANPNTGWISNDYSQVANNTIQVPQFEDDNQLAIEHLRGLTAMGDGVSDRYILGLNEGRKLYYNPVSQQLDYTFELGDPRRQLYDASGSLIAPWKIRPGKWVFFSDFIPGLGSPFENFHADPRMLRVESVQFDMRTPFAVQFAGGIYSQYEQRSARLGLRGAEV